MSAGVGMAVQFDAEHRSVKLTFRKPLELEATEVAVPFAAVLKMAAQIMLAEADAELGLTRRIVGADGAPVPPGAPS